MIFSGKSGGVKENDVDDYLANDVHYVGSHYTGTTLPLKASNKEPSKCYIKVKQHLLLNNMCFIEILKVSMNQCALI